MLGLIPYVFVYCHSLNLCLLGSFSCFLSSADLFQFFQKYRKSVKQFGSRSGPTKCRPDLDSNCLQKLSTDDTNM